MLYFYRLVEDKRPKVRIREYLYHSDEPRDDVSCDTPAALETQLLENSNYMRQEFRHIARKMRYR